MPLERIAILSVHTSPLAALGGKKTGGMNVYVRELAKELAQSGIEVDVYTRRSDPNLPEVDMALGHGARVIYVNSGPQQTLNPEDIYPHLSQFAAGVIAFSTKHGIKYDLVYSHYWLSGWVANKLKEVWNMPIVHMFHTLGHMKNRIGAGQSMLPDLRITIETQIVDWADRIIAATQAEYAQLLWLYRADRRKIDIVPPGVDSRCFTPIPRSEARAKLGIRDDQKLMLFVGRIEPLKAVDTIIEAIDLLRSEKTHLTDDLTFAIIGGDPGNPADTELSRLRQLSKSLNLNDVVDFLGAKDHQLLPYFYSAAEAVIMPSDYESFGMVALEAMSSGTPVIATEVGGLAFLVRDGETGFLVPVRDPHALADRIETLLADPQKQRELGDNAVALAQQYQWSHIKDRLLKIFQELTRTRVR